VWMFRTDVCTSIQGRANAYTAVEKVKVRMAFVILLLLLIVAARP
jgi:hypothetical protein